MKWLGPDLQDPRLGLSPLEWILGAGLGLTDGAPGLLIRLPSPRRWESELRLASADRGLRAHETVSVAKQRESQWADRGPQPLAPLFCRRGGTSAELRLSLAGAYLR